MTGNPQERQDTCEPLTATMLCRVIGGDNYDRALQINKLKMVALLDEYVDQKLETLQTQLAAKEAECVRLREALVEVAEWIDTWGADWEAYPEWPATNKKLREALSTTDPSPLMAVVEAAMHVDMQGCYCPLTEENYCGLCRFRDAVEAYQKWKGGV